MGKPGVTVSFPVRVRIKQLAENGVDYQVIAKMTGVNRNTVRRWAGRKSEQPCAKPLPKRTSFG